MATNADRVEVRLHRTWLYRPIFALGYLVVWPASFFVSTERAEAMVEFFARMVERHGIRLEVI
jgi:hypothetical protein